MMTEEQIVKRYKEIRAEYEHDVRPRGGYGHTVFKHGIMGQLKALEEVLGYNPLSK
jgi:hypothetical protein